MEKFTIFTIVFICLSTLLQCKFPMNDVKKELDEEIKKEIIEAHSIKMMNTAEKKYGPKEEWDRKKLDFYKKGIEKLTKFYDKNYKYVFEYKDRLNSKTKDTDGDGIINLEDDDIDNDGIKNSEDDDIDGDGILNYRDGDDDDDCIPDSIDMSPSGI